MEVDIRAIAQKLIAELNVQEMIQKARAEGVALLYERIRQASEQHSESAAQPATEAEDKP